MPKVIADSDDDSDDIGSACSLSDGGGDNASPSHNRDNTDGAEEPPLPEHPSLRSAPGTSSTERLKQDLAAAHHELFGTHPQTESARNSSGEHIVIQLDSSPDPLMPSKKRPKTISDLEVSQPRTKPAKRAKTVRTYGREEKLNSDVLSGPVSDFEAIKATTPLRGPDLNSSDSNGQAAVDRSDRFLNPSGSIDRLNNGRNDNEEDSRTADAADEQLQPCQYPLISLEPSSTIPDNTMTEQQLVNAAVSGTSFNQELPPAQTQQSVPWSTYLTLPSDQSDPPATLGPAREFPTSNEPDSSRLIASSANQSRPRLSQTRSSASIGDFERPNAGSKIIDRPGPYEELQKEKDNEDATSKNRRQPPCPADPIEAPVEKAGKLKPVSKKRRAIENEDIDELCSSENPFPPSRSVSVSKQARLKPAVEADELDDTAIGIPQETYKVRPSRSRGAPIQLHEAIDHSVRPEKIAKSRPRRSKTIGTSLVRSNPSLCEKVDMIVAMGFGEEQARQALGENGSNLEAACDWLAERAPTSSAGHGKSSSQRGDAEDDPSDIPPASKPGSDVLEYSSHNELVEKHPRPVSRPHISIEIPPSDNLPSAAGPMEPTDTIAQDAAPAPKRGRGRPPKTPRTLPDCPFPEAALSSKQTAAEDGEPIAPSDDVVPVEPAKKRGRGRPKSVQKSVLADLPDKEMEEVPDSLDKDTAVPPKSSEQAPEASESPVPAASGPPSTPPAPKDISTKPPQPPSEPKVHSPINKGKVPYRVGLSRKMRIAPLLKVIRK